MRIPGAEIVALFRRVLSGESVIFPDGISWDDVWAGNFHCHIDGYSVVIFNDCGECDYVDSATAPDGRTGDFDSWYDGGDEPVAMLEMSEVAKMEDILENCGAAS